MDVQHLKYFVAVAQARSFTYAAESLFVTQPMLTRTVKALETELNVRLIERTSKSFHLTDAGERLFQHATMVLGHYEDTFRIMSDIEKNPSGEVRLSIPGVLLDLYFSPLLTQFRAKYPGITISIVEEGSQQSARTVLRNEADMSLVMLPVEKMDELDVQTAVHNQVHLILPKHHPLAQEPSVDISRLRGLEIVTYGNDATLYNTFLQMCRLDGFEPAVVCKTLMPLFALDLVSRGSCVGILPAPLLKHYPYPDLVSVPLTPSFEWQIAIIRRKNHYHSYASRHFCDFMKTYFRTLAQQQTNPILDGTTAFLASRQNP